MNLHTGRLPIPDKAQSNPRSLAAWVSLVLCLAGLHSPARGSVLDPRAVQSATLSNGLRLVVCADSEAAVVSVEVVIRAGSADDPPGQEGAAHLLEHVLWAGYGPQDPRLRIEQIGGIANAGALRDFTRFYATVPVGYMDLALDALSQMVLLQDFDEESLARECHIILEEAAVRSDDPHAILNDLAFQELYGPAHPYRHPIEGDSSTLHTITPSQLSLFYSTWYVPNNMSVVICGDVGFESAHAAVESAFGHLLPAATPRMPRPQPAPPDRERERITQLPTGQAYLAAVFPAPPVSDYDQVCASDLIATLLAYGPFGRLVRDLKDDRQLASAVGVDFLTQRDPALFAVWAACKPEHIPAVKQAVREQLARLGQDPVAPDELATAKRLLTAAYAFANETCADRAATLAFYEAVDTYRSATQYLPRVQSLTAKQVAQTAARYAAEPIWIVLQPTATRR